MGMRIVLEDLDDVQFRRIGASLNMALAMWDFQGYLRSQVKWGDPPDDIETIYEKWFETLNANGIVLENILE